MVAPEVRVVTKTEVYGLSRPTYKETVIKMGVYIEKETYVYCSQHYKVSFFVESRYY